MSMESTMTDTINQKDEIETLTKTLVVEVLSLELSLDKIKKSTNLYNLGLDSMNVVDLLLELEARLDFVLDPEDIRPEMFEEFGKLIEYLSSKVGIAA